MNLSVFLLKENQIQKKRSHANIHTINVYIVHSILAFSIQLLISYLSESSSVYSIQQREQVDTEQTSQTIEDPIVEVITPDVYNKYGADGSRDPFSGIWSRTLRIKITGRDGVEKLDLRIPVSDHTLQLNKFKRK